MEKQKRKILYIHHAGGLGGAPRSLFLLLSHLDLNLYDAKLICIEKGPVLDLFSQLKIPLEVNENLFPFHGSTVVAKWSRFVYKNNIFKFWQTFKEAKKVLLKEQPSIVHLNSSSLCMVAWAAKNIDKNIKVICHVREPLRRSLFGFIIKWVCYKYIDQFIAIEKFSADSMKTRNNIKVVYNPVDLNIYNPSNPSLDVIRNEFKIDKNGIIFLFLARVSPGNGVLELLEIASKLEREYLNFHFIISGFLHNAKDKYSQKVKRISARLPNVHLLTFRNEVTTLILSADVMIIPFTEPHFARAGIEAAAMGKPCIGANIGGVNECIIHGKTGYLYNNSQEFRDYCIKLGTDVDERLRMGANGVDFAARNFDIKISSSNVFEIYNNI